MLVYTICACFILIYHVEMLNTMIVCITTAFVLDNIQSCMVIF